MFLRRINPSRFLWDLTDSAAVQLQSHCCAHVIDVVASSFSATFHGKNKLEACHIFSSWVNAGVNTLNGHKIQHHLPTYLYCHICHSGGGLVTRISVIIKHIFQRLSVNSNFSCWFNNQCLFTFTASSATVTKDISSSSVSSVFPITTVIYIQSPLCDCHQTNRNSRFLPHDTMLARYTLSLCVRLSVHHKSEFCQNGYM